MGKKNKENKPPEEADLGGGQSREAVPEIQARQVVYCEICALPPEYCEFGGSLKRCKEWLITAHPELYERIYSDQAVEDAMGDMSLEKKEKVAKEIAKKQEKEERKQEKELAKKAASKVTIKRIERTKRKHVIAVTGMEVFGLELKKVAKVFANKFATGASVTKGLLGNDEIIVQGDLSDEIYDLITEKYPEIQEENLEQVEEKPKKKAAA